jgi:ion channel-forming bestrophin family protein
MFQIFELVLQTSLAFLLVFRLNRCALRFWETRTMWGNLMHNTRNLVGGILVHCRHAPHSRDEAIQWAASFCVATKHCIRRELSIPRDQLAGVLTMDHIERMQAANHAPLYAASMVRYHLRQALSPLAPNKNNKYKNSNVSLDVGYAHAIAMKHLEELMDSMIAQVSGMERVRSTPLPMVYIAHLRTFLFGYLAVLPYVYVERWGWWTVPLVAFASFALLGIEGAASECEIPFDKNRANHLAMDAYCLVLLDNIQGLVVQDADLDLLERHNEDTWTDMGD